MGLPEGDVVVSEGRPSLRARLTEHSGRGGGQGPRVKAYPGICLGFLAVWPELCVSAEPPAIQALDRARGRGVGAVGDALCVTRVWAGLDKGKQASLTSNGPLSRLS